MGKKLKQRPLTIAEANDVRSLVQKAFAGGGLSAEESLRCSELFRINREEYNLIAEGVRASERNKMRLR